jgi:hypothetical protein
MFISKLRKLPNVFETVVTLIKSRFWTFSIVTGYKKTQRFGSWLALSKGPN